MYYKHLVFDILFLLPDIIQIFLCIQCLLIVCYLIGIGIAKVLSDGAHSLLGQFTDLTFSREENKNKVIRCGFFNLSIGIFWVFYEKFDWIILKIWSLLLFSQSVRELMGDWKEGSVNRPRREWAPSDNTLGIAIREIF